jgi:DNA-binding response OmpR family regulator
MGELAGKRVLVVEDDFLIALDLETFLADHGCLVIGPEHSVTSGLEALDAADPDAAVLDINLGEENSGRLADALRGRGIPFLFLSGHSTEALPCGHAGRPLINKPWNQHKLRAALTALVE